MLNFLCQLCGVEKVIIGGVHLLPLPGSPRYDASGGIARIYHRAREDAMKLAEGGVDALLFANEADIPYQTKVGPETIAGMTYCITRVMMELQIPFGVNLLLDPSGGVAIAKATGASFVRGYFCGAYVGDMGILNTNGAEVLRFRRYIGAEEVKLLHNVMCAFGIPLASRDLKAVAHGAIIHGGIDGLTVSGQAAGFEPDLQALSTVKQVAGSFPVLAGTGVSAENVRKILQVADGAIVASSLKEGGATLNPVDVKRVKRFMSIVKEIRKEVEMSENNPQS